MDEIHISYKSTDTSGIAFWLREWQKIDSRITHSTLNGRVELKVSVQEGFVTFLVDQVFHLSRRLPSECDLCWNYCNKLHQNSIIISGKSIIENIEVYITFEKIEHPHGKVTTQIPTLSIERISL